MPAIGSFNALPTCSADDCKSVPMACEISAMACVALPKFTPLICVNVANTFSADNIASSLNIDLPLLALNVVAISAICVAVSPAAMPVDFTTASVCASADWNSLASLILPPMKSPTLDNADPAKLIAASPIRISAPVAMVCSALNPPPAFFAVVLMPSTLCVMLFTTGVTSSSPVKRISTVVSLICVLPCVHSLQIQWTSVQDVLLLFASLAGLLVCSGKYLYTILILNTL